MIDERRLEQHFGEEPKPPALRPFLASRVKAHAAGKLHRLGPRLHLIWTAVLLACFAACAQVHLPAAVFVLPAAAVFVIVLTKARHSAGSLNWTLLLTGQSRRRS